MSRCICKGNWRKIVANTEPLIGRWFLHEGEEWSLFGIVHGGDDYYYGMFRDGKLLLLSCVASIEMHGFEPVAPE